MYICVMYIYIYTCMYTCIHILKAFLIRLAVDADQAAVPASENNFID